MLKKNFLSTTMVSLFFGVLLFCGGCGLEMFVLSATAGTVARVATGQVILRTGPAITYKAIATIPTGAKVHINGCLSNKAWCSLYYNRKAGWASAHYLNFNNVPTIAFTHMYVKPNSLIKAPKEKMKRTVSGFKTITVPQKTRKNVQKLYRTDVIIDATGVKKRDERTIFNPSEKAHDVSVKHVTAYNPFFPNDVNFRNFERNETRYRIVTYPAP
ncbi:SH3 domain-containing protein [Bartonella heixiaziensis]|uniref:SH3 domain-containing protein n=1 Tax=Bartonella heixiaziensis TaxID=1461000 RepID=UPI003908BB9C